NIYTMRLFTRVTLPACRLEEVVNRKAALLASAQHRAIECRAANRLIARGRPVVRKYNFVLSTSLGLPSAPFSAIVPGWLCMSTSCFATRAADLVVGLCWLLNFALVHWCHLSPSSRFR